MKSMIGKLLNIIKSLILSVFRIVCFVILIYTGFYLYGCINRPPRTLMALTIRSGMVYQRKIFDDPQRMVAHIVEIDLTTNDHMLFVKEPDRPGNPLPYLAQTTRGFAEQHQAVVAINASFFEPFRYGIPGIFYPRAGEPTVPLGLTTTNGRIETTSRFKALCVLPKRVLIASTQCPADTVGAVSGNEQLIVSGRATRNRSTYSNRSHPRTAIATNESGTVVWLIVIDGRQPFYSDGATIAQLTNIGTTLGAYNMINLDGGGSSSLVINMDGEPHVMNSPIHMRIPGYERPVADHIGVYDEP